MACVCMDVRQVPLHGQVVQLLQQQAEIKRLSWCLAPRVLFSDLYAWTYATAMHTLTRSHLDNPVVCVTLTH